MSWKRPTPEQQQEAREARKQANMDALCAPSTGKIHVGRYGGEVRPVAAQPKPETFRSERWLAAVRDLGICVRCGRHGVQAAHRNEGKGMAQKAHDCAVAALCPECHTELDSGRTMVREAKRAEMDRCIVLTVVALALAGKVTAT